VQAIVKREFVQDDGLTAGPLPRGDRRGAAQRCEKRVRTVQLDGAVRAIEVTCSCGETTLIEIDYPNA
jgi:hypothetical protein